MSLLGSLLAYVGHFGITLGSLWGHFGITLGSLRAYRRRFACLMHIISPCVRSKRAHKQETHVLPTSFACQRMLGYPNRTNNGASRTVWEGVGEGKPSPLVGLFELMEVWRVSCWFKASTRLEARGLGGFWSISGYVAAWAVLVRSLRIERTIRDSI